MQTFLGCEKECEPGETIPLTCGFNNYKFHVYSYIFVHADRKRKKIK
jgi:hypothetical protein